MARALSQIIVIPYRINENKMCEFAIFKRSDEHYWQWIAGGGEDDETPLQASARELFEETGIREEAKLINLQYSAFVPISEFKEHRLLYEKFNLLEIPEYYFAFEITNEKICLSHEHTEFKWVDYENANELLHWQTNKNGLRELNERLKKNLYQN